MRDSVLVTGATSQLGVFLLPRLRDGGFRVMALSRRAPVTVSSEDAQLSWQHPVSWLGEGSGGRHPAVQHLVSCGPLELACDLVARTAGLQRLVAFSTSSVLTKAGSANKAEHEHMALIRQQELRLKNRCEAHGIALLLLRPTLIYGCGMDRNISLLARFGQRFGFIPVAGSATGLRQPVHADDLAALAVQAFCTGKAVKLESVVCGGSTLSYREMAEKIASCCGRRVRALAVPPRMLAAGVQALAMFPSFRTINGEMVRRQGRDMVFDDSALRKVLDYQPRTFTPGPADFAVPADAARCQLPA